MSSLLWPSSHSSQAY